MTGEILFDILYWNRFHFISRKCVITPATIRDVAKKADVGVGTVSRVLNDSPAVSEATREKVLDAIEALDYRPNPIARQLSIGRTPTI